MADFLAWVRSWRLTHWWRRGHVTTADAYRTLAQAPVIREKAQE